MGSKDRILFNKGQVNGAARRDRIGERSAGGVW